MSVRGVCKTRHDYLSQVARRASIWWAVAQPDGQVPFNTCSVMHQMLFSATEGASPPSLCTRWPASSPAVEFWTSLRPWFENLQQHTELSLSSSRTALGRSRAPKRDAGRVLSGSVSHSRQALLDGTFWLFFFRRGNFWCFTGGLESPEVGCCVPVVCPALDLLRFHIGAVRHFTLLTSAPHCPVQPALWPLFVVQLSPDLCLPHTRCVDLLRAQAKQVLPPQPSLWDPWSTSKPNRSTLVASVRGRKQWLFGQ